MTKLTLTCNAPQPLGGDGEGKVGEACCLECNPGWQLMMLCKTCGNKRCPRATNHRNACTNCNEPDQPGSIYGGLSPAPPPVSGLPEGKVAELLKSVNAASDYMEQKAGNHWIGGVLSDASKTIEAQAAQIKELQDHPMFFRCADHAVGVLESAEACPGCLIELRTKCEAQAARIERTNNEIESLRMQISKAKFYARSVTVYAILEDALSRIASILAAGEGGQGVSK